MQLKEKRRWDEGFQCFGGRSTRKFLHPTADVSMYSSVTLRGLDPNT